MTVSTLINQTLTTPVALTRWVETTRAHAPLLDEDAGPLLARLNALRASAQTLNALASAHARPLWSFPGGQSAPAGDACQRFAGPGVRGTWR